jgi:N-acetylmuramoyl-L-alanine amidase
MPETPPPHDDDEQFEAWRQNREEPPPPASLSVTFMEMMRRSARESDVPAEPPSDVPVEAVPETAEATPDTVEAAPDTLEPEPPIQLEAQEAVQAPPARRRPPAEKVEFNLVDDRTGEVRRVSKRRRIKRGRRTVSLLGGLLRSFIVILAAAGLTATIFTWTTPPGFIASGVRAELSIAEATAVATAAPTALPTPNWAITVGIVSGHRGPQNDPGAVCPDGLTEAEINFAVAQMVVQNLRGMGYSAELLDEFDARLNNYQASALLSIHSNTCQEWPGGEVVSGYLLAAPAARVTARGNDELLVNCISRYYGQATGLERRSGVTQDMTDYHNFREIHPLTPGAIIELGFMLADRDVLVNRREDMARGITDGLLCFLEPLRFQPTTPPT